MSDSTSNICSISMTKSASIGKLAEALSTAQGKMRSAKKESSNPFLKSSYADLASIIDACRGPLSEQKIAFSQSPGQSEKGDLFVDTLLFHASDQWIEGRIYIHPVKMDPQSTGSAITYARRYALQAMLGIAAEEDDDGALSSSPKKKVEPKLPSGSFELVPETISNEEKSRITESSVVTADFIEKFDKAKTTKEIESIGSVFKGELKNKIVPSDLEILRLKYSEAISFMKVK